MRRLDELSAREREVLDLVRLELTNEEIARRLGISLAGAKYHVSQILSKLGVSSREEAAALTQERRPWWTRALGWGLAAKIAGAAVVVGAAAVGVGVLAWGILETGGTKEDNVSSGVAPSATAGVIGSYSDPYDAGSFLSQLDVAVQKSDVDWFLANTIFENFPCDQWGLPARPDACEGQPSGSAVAAVTIGVLQSDGFAADHEQYAALIRDYLTNFDTASSDEYGDGALHLYAWGVRSAEFGKDSSFPAYVTGVVTRIAATQTAQGAPSPTFPPAGRSVMLFDASYDGGNWRIRRLSIGGGQLDPNTVAQMLDPAGRGAPDGVRLWDFWSRWPPDGALEPALRSAKPVGFYDCGSNLEWVQPPFEQVLQHHYLKGVPVEQVRESYDRRFFPVVGGNGALSVNMGWLSSTGLSQEGEASYRDPQQPPWGPGDSCLFPNDAIGARFYLLGYRAEKVEDAGDRLVITVSVLPRGYTAINIMIPDSGRPDRFDFVDDSGVLIDSR